MSPCSKINFLNFGITNEAISYQKPGVGLKSTPTVFVLLALLQIDFLIFLAVPNHGLCVRIKSMTTHILTVKERQSYSHSLGGSSYLALVCMIKQLKSRGNYLDNTNPKT